MNNLGNIAEIPVAFMSKDEQGMVTKELGKAAGSRRIYANLDSVPQNSYSTKYHSHTNQEEFFYILSGKGTLRLNNVKKCVGAGDFIAKPAGESIAHSFYNPYKEPLVILDIGTAEERDTCYYPDEDVYLYKDGDERKAVKDGTELEEWSSSPVICGDSVFSR